MYLTIKQEPKLSKEELIVLCYIVLHYTKIQLDG